jgi:hypothetical protein
MLRVLLVQQQQWTPVAMGKGALRFPLMPVG